MAVRWAVLAGLWSATATWNGGTLPAAGDDVYANNRIVTVDQSIDVNTLRNVALASPVIAAGGYFDVATATGQVITVTAGIDGTRDTIGTSGLPTLQIRSATGALTVNANLTGSTVSNRIPVRFKAAAAFTLTLNGNIVAGQGANNRYALDWGDQISSNDRSPTVTINGDVDGGLTLCPAINITNTGSVITINGDVHAGEGIGIYLSSGNFKLTINGDIVGGSSLSRYGVQDAGADTTARITVNGRIYGGTGQNAYGIYSRLAVWRSQGLAYGATGTAPIGGGVSGGEEHHVIRGSGFSLTLPSDDDWPLATGELITLAEPGTPCPDCPPEDAMGVLWPPNGRVR